MCKTIPNSSVQNVYRTKVSIQDRIYSAHKMVMIHDDLLMVHSFTVDDVDISFMLHKLLRH